MFLRNILYAVLIVVLVRFVLRTLSALVRQGRTAGRPEVRPGARDDRSPGPGRVIDVDYTEHPDAPRKDR